MSQLSFCHLRRAMPAATLIAVGLFLAGPNGPARAGPILDPIGDFLPTYTGAQDAGLDVLAHEVTLVGDRLNFFGRMAGPIAPTQTVGGLYLIGIDRGLGTPRFLNSPAAPPTIGPNVKWDAIVRILPNGTAFYLNSLLSITTPLSTSDVSIIGNEFNVSIPVSLMLLSATKPPEEWTYNLWPRNGVGLNVQVSDLGPDDGNSPVHAVPEPVSLVACGIGALGLLGCRWRQKRYMARELVMRRQSKWIPMTKHLTLLVTATLSVIALSAGVGVRPANAAAGNIYNLGTLGGTSSTGHDINDAGQVVGGAQDAVGGSRAFLWDSIHGMTDLATANGYALAAATAINASGSVAGIKHGSETGFPHAFAWMPNAPNGTTGTMADLARGHHSAAADINAAGQVVGYSSSTYFVDGESCTPDAPYYPNCGSEGYWVTETSAVLWENGVGTDLPSSSATNIASAINDAGQVAGNSYYDTNGTSVVHAFRYDGTPGAGGVMHDLGTLGGSVSAGSAINNAGQVVGDSWTTGDTAHRAFRYTGTPGAGGVMVELGTLGGPYNQAVDINEAGFVVGSAYRAAGAGDGFWATLWLNDAGNTAVDLDAWLDAINPTLGAYWALTEARAINNNGLITGQGIYDDGPGGLSDGIRAFVLDASSLLSAIPGDYNGNGTVGPEDYDMWKTDFGSTTLLAADGNGNHIVDAADYTIWRDHLGNTLGFGGGAALAAAALLSPAVPEPSALSIAATYILLLLAQNRRRGRTVIASASLFETRTQ